MKWRSCACNRPEKGDQEQDERITETSITTPETQLNNTQNPMLARIINGKLVSIQNAVPVMSLICF